MSCKLNKFKSYDIGQVHYDNGSGAYSVILLNPGADCPDATFVSKRAELMINANTAPTLTYNTKDEKPVITVPTKDYIMSHGSNFNFLGYGLWLIALIVLFFIGRKIYLSSRKPNRPNLHKSLKTTPMGYHNSQGYSTSTGNTPYGSSCNNHYISPTIVNNNGASSTSFLETLVLTDMLSSNHSSGNTENVYNVTNDYNGDANNNFSSDNDNYSSDTTADNDSYSSDSSSDDSYSSDSSSDDSYSSDSSSDFSD